MLAEADLWRRWRAESRLVAGCRGSLLLSGRVARVRAGSAQMDSREGIALQNQILELRRDMQQLQYMAAAAAAGRRRPAAPP